MNIKDKLKQTKIIINEKRINSNYKYLVKKYDILNEIKEHTSFLIEEETTLFERIYCIKNDIHQISVCSNETCNRKIKFSQKEKYKKYCSRKCSNTDTKIKNKKKKIMKERYGAENSFLVPEFKQKRIETMIERYGTEHALLNKSILEKRKETYLNNFGYIHSSQHPEVKKKKNQTCLKKYNTKYPIQNKKIKQKRIETMVERYGVQHYKQEHFKDLMILLDNKQWLVEQHHTNKRTLSHIAKELNIDKTTVGKFMKKHNVEIKFYNNTSMPEQDILKFLDSLKINNYKTNCRDVLNGKEIDIYLPEHKIAIEYCGLYWHSEYFNRDKHYHKNKYDLCKRQNIQLITIFEDEWLERQEQVKAKLKSLLSKDDRQKIYARDTSVINVTTKTKKQFFEDNHIQGNGPGSINIGLIHNGRLVACMSFIKQKNNVFVLNRYATSCRVVGGFSKLLKHFQNNYSYKQIISFADLRWSDGNLYKKTGWKLDKTLDPDYYYIRNQKRIHKFNYRRKHLPNLLEHFDPNLSEKQNCDNNGILRIWDCGKTRFVI